MSQKVNLLNRNLIFEAQQQSKASSRKLAGAAAPRRTSASNVLKVLA